MSFRVFFLLCPSGTGKFADPHKIGTMQHRARPRVAPLARPRPNMANRQLAASDVFQSLFLAYPGGTGKFADPNKIEAMQHRARPRVPSPRRVRLALALLDVFQSSRVFFLLIRATRASIADTNKIGAMRHRARPASRKPCFSFGMRGWVSKSSEAQGAENNAKPNH